MPSGLGPAAWKGPALSLPREMTSDHSRAVGFQFPGSLYNSPASSLCAFNEKLGCGGVVSTAVELLSALEADPASKLLSASLSSLFWVALTARKAPANGAGSLIASD